MLRCLSTVRADIGRLLSSDRLCTPNSLRNIFYHQKNIDASTLSTLIALFGSLSAPSHVYGSPLLSRMREVGADHRSYWEFIVRVGTRKVQNGMSLTDSDRFWLMRAALAASQVLVEGPLNKASARKLTTFVMRARHHYHAIRSHAFHPEVYVPYMKTLLGTRNPRYVAFVAQDMVYALQAHSFYHPRLLQVLHSLVLQHGMTLSNETKDAIVSALWKRVWNAHDTVDTPSHPRNDGGVNTHFLDVTDVAHHLLACLSQDLHSSDPWLVHELRTVLSPSQELSQRWMALTLVALFHSPVEATTNDALDELQSPATACWRVIFGLATMEKLFKSSVHSSTDSPFLRRAALRETLRVLYETWFHVVDTRSVPRDIACAITASFFRLAGFVYDTSLVEGCLALCDLGMLWGPGPDLAYTIHHHVHASSNAFMSAQYIVALLRLHGPNADMVLRTLCAISEDTQWQCTVLATVLHELVIAEPELALAVYRIAEHSGRGVGPQHVHTLAVSLAQSGALEHAVGFLRDGNVGFLWEQRGTLLAAIIRRIQNDAPHYPPVLLLTSLADAFLALYASHSPPENVAHALGGLLLILCRHGQGCKAVDVLVSIIRTSPRCFKLVDIRRFCHVLLRHRQFKCAVRILDVVESLCPPVAHGLRTTVAIAATCAGATRTIKNLRGHLTLSVETFLWYRIQTNLDRTRTHSGYNTLRNRLSLRLATFLRTLSPDDPAFDHLLAELLRSGRILASKRIFLYVLPSTPSPLRRTTLANVLLSGISRSHHPRNGRRVRKVLGLVEDLVETHGIKPDRVTLNIVVRTMLGWRTVFDTMRVRALFDQLVRRGYPAGDVYSVESPPFGFGSGVSMSTPGVGRLGIGIEEKLDFERHVRPLYKMFIRAFYTRDDVEAARKVIEILKVEERKDEHAKMARVLREQRGMIMRRIQGL
ncbi:hypothetical protein J3A83DRAFT_4113049 [Scleroderma citrinum]